MKKLTMKQIEQNYEDMALFFIRAKTIEQAFEAVIRSIDEDGKFNPSQYDIGLIKAAEKHLT